MVHRPNHQQLAPLGPGMCSLVFFGRFLLRLSKIKRPQVMSMVKFSPTALIFGYDFVPLVNFLGFPVYQGLFFSNLYLFRGCSEL